MVKKEFTWKATISKCIYVYAYGMYFSSCYKEKAHFSFTDGGLANTMRRGCKRQSPSVYNENDKLI